MIRCLGWLLAGGLALWALWIEPRQLHIRHETVALRGLAAPLRLAVIADPQPNRLHWSPERLRDVLVARINAERPDVTVLLGDYTDPARWDPTGWARMLPAETLDALAGLVAPGGVFGILGNQESALGSPAIVRHMAAGPIQPLVNAAVRVQSGQAALWLVGIDDPYWGHDDLYAAMGKAGRDAPVVLLTHGPRPFERQTVRAPLTLAGHTHCGQLWLPLLGRPGLWRHSDARYGCGWYEKPPIGAGPVRRMLVSAGVGSSLVPLRFLTPPEVHVLTLIPETDMPEK